MRDSFYANHMRQIDRDAAQALQISSFELMQRAGRAVATRVLQEFPLVDQWLVLCGPGNNGGDGYVIAKALLDAGRCLAALTIKPASTDDCQRAREEYLRAGGKAFNLDQCNQALLEASGGFVDAVFGIGARAIDAEKDAELANLFQQIAIVKKPIVAVDLPSGLCADTGAADAVLAANLTVTLLAQKPGLHTGKARAYCGKIVLESLSAMITQVPDVSLQDQLAYLPAKRSPIAHKGSFGHVCLLGGRLGQEGAIALSAQAALRAGSGLVSVLSESQERLAQLDWPEIMQKKTSADGFALPANCSVLAIGPGLGLDANAKQLWKAAVEAASARGIPIVLDADGLNLLANKQIPLPESTVLTPHPLEAARLLGCSVPTIEANRIAAALALRDQYQAIVVLKGAGSIICGLQQLPVICTRGNPGMASGGMGDVLTGVIASFIAQGLNPWQAACDGVVAHALAGDLAAKDGERGMRATDVVQTIRTVVNAL
jgi:ADP-dependent NAD(P)H-hydrate dehydratase / NAD(P)H-hydrate epimerase